MLSQTYCLVFQVAIWHWGTHGRPKNRLVFNPDKLYVWNDATDPPTLTKEYPTNGTAANVHHMRVTNDGKVAIETASGQVISYIS